MAQRYFRDRSTDLIFIVVGVLCYSATYCSCEEAGIPKVRSLSSHNYVSTKFNQAPNIPDQRPLIKRRRKRVKTKHSGEQIVKDRQIVNLEAFLLFDPFIDMCMFLIKKENLALFYIIYLCI